MADVYCRCGKQVGYKFVRDKTPDGRNHNQVQRCELNRHTRHEMSPPHSSLSTLIVRLSPHSYLSTLIVRHSPQVGRN